jgi:hypothetical protein
MCVQITRRTGRPPIAPASTSSQAARVSGVVTPVSTTVHPSPSRSAQTLTWFSAIGSGIRIQSSPSATGAARPSSGASSHG